MRGCSSTWKLFNCSNNLILIINKRNHSRSFVFTANSTSIAIWKYLLVLLLAFIFMLLTNASVYCICVWCVACNYSCERKKERRKSHTMWASEQRINVGGSIILQTSTRLFLVVFLISIVSFCFCSLYYCLCLYQCHTYSIYYFLINKIWMAVFGYRISKRNNFVLPRKLFNDNHFDSFLWMNENERVFFYASEELRISMADIKATNK